MSNKTKYCPRLIIRKCKVNNSYFEYTISSDDHYWVGGCKAAFLEDAINLERGISYKTFDQWSAWNWSQAAMWGYV